MEYANAHNGDVPSKQVLKSDAGICKVYGAHQSVNSQIADTVEYIASSLATARVTEAEFDAMVTVRRAELKLKKQQRAVVAVVNDPNEITALGHTHVFDNDVANNDADRMYAEQHSGLSDQVSM